MAQATLLQLYQREISDLLDRIAANCDSREREALKDYIHMRASISLSSSKVRVDTEGRIG